MGGDDANLRGINIQLAYKIVGPLNQDEMDFMVTYRILIEFLQEILSKFYFIFLKIHFQSSIFVGYWD